MTTIAFAPKAPTSAMPERELLGMRRTPDRWSETVPAEPVAPPRPSPPTELEKAVRRMPTLYVIAFFGIVVLSAVLIIWNTLQVNLLTAQETKLDTQIAQTEQRLIRLRAEEMQLSAPERIRALAQTNLGMVEAQSQDIITVK